MQNKISDGNTIEFTAAADHGSGDMVEIGALITVVQEDVKTGGIGVAVISGCFSVPKKTGTAWAVGDALELDTGELTPQSTGSIVAWAGAAAASGDTTGAAILNRNSG